MIDGRARLGGVVRRAVAGVRVLVTIGCTRGGHRVRSDGEHVGRPRDPCRYDPCSRRGRNEDRPARGRVGRVGKRCPVALPKCGRMVGKWLGGGAKLGGLERRSPAAVRRGTWIQRNRPSRCNVGSRSSEMARRWGRWYPDGSRWLGHAVGRGGMGRPAIAGVNRDRNQAMHASGDGRRVSNGWPFVAAA